MQHIPKLALGAVALTLAWMACPHPTCSGLSCQLHLLQLPARAVTLHRQRAHLKAGRPRGHSSVKLVSQQRCSTPNSLLHGHAPAGTRCPTEVCNGKSWAVQWAATSHKAASSPSLLPKQEASFSLTLAITGQ